MVPIQTSMESGFECRDGLAVVVGCSGAIGRALLQHLKAEPGWVEVIGLSRSVGEPRLDLRDEGSIRRAADHVAGRAQPLRLLIDATGVLHDDALRPEKSVRQIDAGAMAQAFATNAIGPALLAKHFLPLLARDGRAVFASLSAKVGSIGDNHLGGWHSYRASKTALNQIIRTCSIELARTHPEALCVALHPGTVDSPLSEPFRKTGLRVRPAEQAAGELLQVIRRLRPADSGGFYDYRGQALPW